jgi:hypothetical protein
MNSSILHIALVLRPAPNVAHYHVKPILSDGFYVVNGRIRSKGYIRISIYHKMRKRQWGNRWQTQFVPLCREEVKRLENRQELNQYENTRNPA